MPRYEDTLRGRQTASAYPGEPHAKLALSERDEIVAALEALRGIIDGPRLEGRYHLSGSDLSRSEAALARLDSLVEGR